MSEQLELGAQAQKEPDVLSVSDLNSAIKSTLEKSFTLVWLKGEISNFTAHRSGHFYFSLKDENSQVSAVMFRGANAHLKFKPKVGDEVIVRARVTVYVPRGNYQVLVEMMEPVGAGALQRQFDQLKAKLQKEGLFADSRKKTLPTLPKKIAVITSATGAAFQDILNVLSRRFSSAEILLIPAVVQGEKCPSSLLQALNQLERLRDVDVAIIGRGGGSMEDLWGFNDEQVARKISTLKVPIISAVGHEIDFTICDFVCDMRAPTPSAAAEIVAKSAAELIQRVNLSSRQLRSLMNGLLRESQLRHQGLQNRLVHPSRRLQELNQRCDDLEMSLQRAMRDRLNQLQQQVKVMQLRLVDPKRVIERHEAELKQFKGRLHQSIKEGVERRKMQLQRSMGMLDSLSPLRVLDRGYTLVTDSGGKVLSGSGVSAAQSVAIHFKGHTAEAKIEKVKKGTEIWNLRKSSKD